MSRATIATSRVAVLLEPTLFQELHRAESRGSSFIRPLASGDASARCDCQIIVREIVALVVDNRSYGTAAATLAFEAAVHVGSKQTARRACTIPRAAATQCVRVPHFVATGAIRNGRAHCFQGNSHAQRRATLASHANQVLPNADALSLKRLPTFVSKGPRGCAHCQCFKFACSRVRCRDTAIAWLTLLEWLQKNSAS